MPPTGVARRRARRALASVRGDFAGASAARRAGALIVGRRRPRRSVSSRCSSALAIVRPPMPGADAHRDRPGRRRRRRGRPRGPVSRHVARVAWGSSRRWPAPARWPCRWSSARCCGAAHRAAPARRRRVRGGGGGRRRRRVARRARAPSAGCSPGLAAVGFGAWYVLIDLAARAGDPLWALVFSRAASAAHRGGRRGDRAAFDRPRSRVRIVLAAGLFDVGGNVLYVIARERDADRPGRRAGRALPDRHDAPGAVRARRAPAARSGQVGVALALLGIVLISVGG